MKKLLSALTLLIALGTLLPLHAQEGGNGKQIIGYYPSWQMYKRAGIMRPAKDNIDYTRYTILNYSFFQCDTLGNLFGTDPWADSILLRGEIDWGKSTLDNYVYFPNTSLIDRAHVWGVRVMVSIGGWTLSDAFPTVAADPERRARFAEECVRILKDYKFDGIDIDWEYPGYAEHSGTPDDKRNFTLLMKAIRKAIDEYGEEIDYQFYLTAAFGASENQMENIEWNNLVDVMDYFNMMTYDFNGTWSSEANHNSPLYSPEKGSPGSLDLTKKLITQKYKVPASKVNLGVAWYGRTLLGFDGPTELFGKHEGKSDSVTFTVNMGMPQYFNVLEHMDEGFVEKWDDVAKVPYLINEKKESFVSYDNEKSIRLKAEYVKDNDLAGVIIWDATGDYVEKKIGSGFLKGTPLCDVLVEVLEPDTKKKKIKKRWY